MLKEDFYTIEAFTAADNTARATLRLRPDHPLYAGHFPGQPVVPGVCWMQIVLELAEEATGTALWLSESRLMKFLLPVDPRATDRIRAELKWTTGDDGSLNTSATFFMETEPRVESARRVGSASFAQAAPCFSFSGVLRPLS